MPMFVIQYGGEGTPCPLCLNPPSYGSSKFCCCVSLYTREEGCSDVRQLQSSILNPNLEASGSSRSPYGNRLRFVVPRSWSLKFAERPWFACLHFKAKGGCRRWLMFQLGLQRAASAGMVVKGPGNPIGFPRRCSGKAFFSFSPLLWPHGIAGHSGREWCRCIVKKQLQRIFVRGEKEMKKGCCSCDFFLTHGRDFFAQKQ